MKQKILERDIKAQIRTVLRLMHIPFFVHVASALSHRGVPDIIGVIPGSGKGLFIEVKKPNGKLSSEQEAFLNEYALAGAITMRADNPQHVIDRLILAGYEPAKKFTIQ